MSSVELHIYDLSQGLARQLSPGLLGTPIEAIWHTGVQVFGREYYYGGGICTDPPGATPYGRPLSTRSMGTTSRTAADVSAFLANISSRFAPHAYHLLDNNCNNFSDALCVFLVGNHIPSHILDLPAQAMSSPIGPLLRPLVDQMQAAITQQSAGHQVDLASIPSQSPTLQQSSKSQPQSPSLKYISKPITLTHANREAIRRKLSEQQPTIFSPSKTPTREALLQHVQTVHPLNDAFPALDYLRLLAVEADHVDTLVEQAPTLVNRFILCPEPPPVACMMTLRILVNLFHKPTSAATLCTTATAETIVEALCIGLELDHASARKTAALVALNFAGAHLRHPSSIPAPTEDLVVRILYAAVGRLNAQPLPRADEATPLLQTIHVLARAGEDSRLLVQAFDLQLERYANLDLAGMEEQTIEAARSVADLLRPAT